MTRLALHTLVLVLLRHLQQIFDVDKIIKCLRYFIYEQGVLLRDLRVEGGMKV